jgi:hypothetical protein
MSGKGFSLKALREERKDTIAAARERMKGQKKEVAALKKVLGGGPATVPEMAGAAGLEPGRALYLLTALLRYGEAREAGMDGRHPRYELVPAESGENEASAGSGEKEAPPEEGA